MTLRIYQISQIFIIILTFYIWIYSKTVYSHFIYIICRILCIYICYVRLFFSIYFFIFIKSCRCQMFVLLIIIISLFKCRLYTDITRFTEKRGILFYVIYKIKTVEGVKMKKNYKTIANVPRISVHYFTMETRIMQ